MNTRRTLIIAVALVLGAVAAFGSYSYMNAVEERAYNDAELVKVFKIKKDVPKGLSGDQVIGEERVASDSMPQEFRPGTAITDINAIRGKVALTNLAANQVLVEGMFVDPRTAQITAAQRVPAGQVAVTVSLDQVQGVAGLLVPGDKVNIMVKLGDGLDDSRVQHLYQNVNVLFIGTQAAPQAGETQEVVNPGSGLITFAVPPDAAERITLAANSAGAKILLTLVPPDNKPAAVPPVTKDNLFTGGLTPYEG